LYELTYQHEEKWFANRCGKINHTSKGFAALAPNLSWNKAPQEHVVEIAVDDTRKLIYTLSSSSVIRTFYMKSFNTLDMVIEKKRDDILRDISHMLSQTDLLGRGTQIVSLSPISAREAAKLHLMATTSTGCRLFLSATRYSGWATASSDAPQSMQFQHIKFPPRESSSSSQRPPSQMTSFQSSNNIDTQSRALYPSRIGLRFPPGYFFCFVNKDSQAGTDLLFISSPDSGRISRPQEPSTLGSRFYETGIWLSLDSRAEAIGLITPPFAAASSPVGFGNELAVQYDVNASEVAILTNTGIHTIRRRRLVDMFAAAIRYGAREDGLEGEIKNFIRLYGRGETTAAALAVACGQGMDITADSRVARITDPDIVECARKSFIEFGGKPTLNENSMVDQALPAIENVKPSPRHEGIALYMSRLVRSIWKLQIIREGTTPPGGLSVSPTIGLTKLQDIQKDVLKLQEFLDKNKSFIDGLAGPESLQRVSSKQEEVALQGEHQALHSLVVLAADIIEGISFVLVLFDERVEEIVLALNDTSRQQLRQLTYEGLFCTTAGKDVAKELVKAIVNRSIANGSNVDTVAEALRRRCGSFCSSDDVVIFKAQEHLKKASEAGGNTDFGRNLLNESLRLFQQVAGSLSSEHLQMAVDQFLSLQFYAG
jgi:nuclear pore complex protein Nup155